MTNQAASATASSPLVTLLVVDDHTLFRRGLIALLSQYEGLSVVGEAGDAAQALRLAPQLQPQVILLDNHLPGVAGIEEDRHAPGKVTVLAGVKPKSNASTMVTRVTSKTGKIRFEAYPVSGTTVNFGDFLVERADTYDKAVGGGLPGFFTAQTAPY